MSTAAATAEKLLTIAEFMALPDDGREYELVRGRLLEMPGRPNQRHVYISLKIGVLFWEYVERNALGRLVGNDAAIITRRDPDTVRGADVAYYSFDAIPPGEIPGKVLEAVPELVFEVMSDSDRWPNVLQKIGEYLQVGVKLVCVLHPEIRIVEVYTADARPRILKHSDEFAIPEVFPDFRCPVSQFFD